MHDDQSKADADLKTNSKPRPNRSLERGVIEQAGALCLRRGQDGDQQILLVASRRNGRWGLPKGHIDAGETSAVAAEREAYEEAGARGRISASPFGSFEYTKDSSPGRYRVSVHVMETLFIESIYPERETRACRWFALSEAIKAAGHAGLQDILKALSATLD